MASLKFFWNNFWNNYDVHSVYTESAQFPKENTQHRDFNKPWRSRYGAGSTWGYFDITASNNKLDFEDSGAVTRVATLTAATYNAETLAAHVETQMEAVGEDVFTVEYLEAGGDVNKFKITNDTGVFELLWNSGANKANSVADTIGFDDAADDIGADNYTADELRIHTAEFIKIDLGSAQGIMVFIIKNHNFQTNSTIRIQGNATDAWGAPSVNETFVWSGPTQNITDDIAIKTWSTSQNYRWWRLLITDKDNPDGYIEVGTIFLGGHFQPTKQFAYNRIITPRDPSLIKESGDGQVASIQRSHFQTWQYRFLGTNQKSSFDIMFDDKGFSKSLFICEDPDTPLTTTFYVMFRSWSWEHLFDSYWNLSLATREER